MYTVYISIFTFCLQTCTSHTKKKDFIMSFLCANLQLEKFGRSILCKQRMNHFPNVLSHSTAAPGPHWSLNRRKNSQGRELCCFHKSMASNWTFWYLWLRQPNDGRCIEGRAPSQSRFLRSDLESQRELFSTMAPTVSKHVKAVRNFWVLTRHYF